MYFCPCPSEEEIDPEAEERAFVSLPRNLSYVDESHFDKYSVSAQFVHNPKIERKIRHDEVVDRQNHTVQDYWRSYLSPDLCPVNDSPAVTKVEVGGCADSGDAVTCPCSAGTENNTAGLVRAVSDTQGDLSRNCTTGDSDFPAADFGHTSLASPFFSNFSRQQMEDDETLSHDDSSLISSTQPESNFLSTSFLYPVVNVANRISSYLHSPPNESMDLHRGSDNGSSVDGILNGSEHLCLINPDSFKNGYHSDKPIVSDECIKVKEILLQSKDIQDFDDLESNASTDSQVLFPKPVGYKGKTYFPRKDVDLSSSDVEDMEPEENQNTGNDLLVVNGNALETEELDQTLILSVEYSSTECSVNVKEYNMATEVTCESPESYTGGVDAGVFFDVEEGGDNSTTVSEVSNDTGVSADYASQDEAELEEEVANVTKPAKMTIEDAIERAASDLRKMSLAMEQSSSIIDVASGLTIHIDKSDSDEPLSREDSISAATAISDSPTIYADEEFNFSRSKLRKSSSLKSKKTPPGTPRRTKSVRFADAMGLDLEYVRQILNAGSPPRIPASAMADLRTGINEDRKEVGAWYLSPCFTQPGSSVDFFKRVTFQKVCLENAIVTDLTITGFVRVSNCSFHKSVRVRYTHNNWATLHDIAASYVQDSCDGPTDRFSFSIVAPQHFSEGNKLHFAVSFNAGGEEFWDSNNGENYAFECFAKSVPTATENAWMHFI